MEQQQEEILMRRSFQKKTVALVLSVLARGLKVCRSVDEPVREVFDGFPEDFIFVLGVYGSRHPVVLQNRRTGLYRAHETVAAASQKRDKTHKTPPAYGCGCSILCGSGRSLEAG